jgi:hypothetical protein
MPEKIALYSFRPGATMTVNSQRFSSDRHAPSQQTAISSAISNAPTIEFLHVRDETSQQSQARRQLLSEVSREPQTRRTAHARKKRTPTRACSLL